MDDNYDSYDLQNVPAADSQAYVSPASDTQPISTQEALDAALAGQNTDQGAAQYTAPDNSQPVAAAPVAAGPVAQAFNAAKDSQLANEQAQATATAAGLASKPGVFSQLMKGLGVSGDLSSSSNLEQLMKLLMGAGALGSTLHRKGTAQNGLSAQQMLTGINPNGTSFNPSQQSAANNYFNTPVGNFANRDRQYASAMPSPIVAGVGTNGMVTGHFADGGLVNTGAAIDPTNMAASNPNQYPYQMAQPASPVVNTYAEGGEVSDVKNKLFDNAKANNGHFISDGALSLVAGNGSGQDDLVHAKLSPGEYVMDADTVASLGDGNNAHGAKVLDAWREELRSHKRGAKSDSIPPQAKTPSSYLKTGALTSMHNSRTK